ncbi:MAG: branched-chain amino acid ABC transporter permease [Deltaproteobacteria bacterium]
MRNPKTIPEKAFAPVLAAMILILLVATPFFAPVYTTVLLTSILMYMTIAVSWALFSGPTGYISLASAAFFGVGIYTSAVFYVMILILFTLFMTDFFIRRSKYGLSLVSIGENEDAAAHAGVNIIALKVIIYAVSAFFMGAAGAVIATRWTYIDPKIAFNPLISFMPVLMAIFGGIRPLYGPIIGAAIFTYLEEFLITRFPYHYMLIFGIIMVVAILYMPNGLVGLGHGIWRSISRRIHADT